MTIKNFNQIDSKECNKMKNEKIFNLNKEEFEVNSERFFNGEALAADVWMKKVSSKESDVENKKKEKEEKLIQVWNNASDIYNYKFITYEELVELIKKYENLAYMKELREIIDEFYSTGDLDYKKKYDEMKRCLPMMSVTCIMNPPRWDKNIIEYTGILSLDVDDKDNVELRGKYPEIKSLIIKDPNTRMAFYSPSGSDYGFKFFAEVKLPNSIIEANKKLKQDIPKEERESLTDMIKDFHKTAYSIVQKYYSEKYNINVDNNATKTQGCSFVGADSELYYYPNSSVFDIEWIYSPKPKQVLKEYCKTENLSIPNYQIMDNIVDKFLKNCKGRNDTVFQLAMQVKYYRISQEEVVQYALIRFGARDFDETEIRITTRNGFKDKNQPHNQYLINNSNNQNIA